MIGVHVFGCNTDYDAQSELWQPAHDELSGQALHRHTLRHVVHCGCSVRP